MISVALEEYLSAEGDAPFTNWLGQLLDGMARVRVAKRMAKLPAALMGDWKAVGGGVIELREDYGPATRVLRPPRDKLGRDAGGRRQTDTARGHRTCTKLLAGLEAAQSA